MCYKHPSNSNLCIKICFSENSKAQLRELNYYNHLLNRNIKWDLLTRFHGVVQTNMGAGYVFDLVTDDNYQPSKTLEYYLKESVPNGTVKALLRLKHYLLQHSIVTTSLRPNNIVCKTNNSMTEKAIIVDDIGNTEFIPISSYSPHFAKRKIGRKWRRFERLLNHQGLDISVGDV